MQTLVSRFCNQLAESQTRSSRSHCACLAVGSVGHSESCAQLKEPKSLSLLSLAWPSSPLQSSSQRASLICKDRAWRA
jgi:hypothetical protein